MAKEIIKIKKPSHRKGKTGIWSKEQLKHNSEWHKGKKLSEETKRKMSLAHKGNKLTDKHKDNIRKANIGSKSHFWKGGTSKLAVLIRTNIMYSKWREMVFLRDDYTCQECGNKGYIEAHHIKPISIIIEENKLKSFQGILSCSALWEIGNGITFCKECHIKLDKFRGRPKHEKEIFV